MFLAVSRCVQANPSNIRFRSRKLELLPMKKTVAWKTVTTFVKYGVNNAKQGALEAFGVWKQERSITDTTGLSIENLHLSNGAHSYYAEGRQNSNYSAFIFFVDFVARLH